MAVNSTNVAAGKPAITGALSVAATSATLPTDATTALDAAFTGLGYIGEDGMVQTIERTVENIRAWGGETVLTSQTEFTETFQITLIEVLNPDVRSEVFGASNVTGTLATGITTKVTAEEMQDRAWVFDLVLHGAVSRIVIPFGKVTEIGEVNYSDGDVVGYPVTITAFPDSTGVCSYEYTKES